METILNIFLVIQNDLVIGFKAKAYEKDGTDEEKIKFLKEQAKVDFDGAYVFNAPQNKAGEFMPYKKFSKIESQGLQYKLFEEIFRKFGVPEKPLICVTPVVDGEVWAK